MATEAPTLPNLDSDIASLVEFAIRALRSASDAETPPILWHYTTAEGLIGIVQNQRLWMSHVTCMNDSEEYRHGLGYLIQAVGIRQRQRPPPPHIQKLYNALIGPVVDMMNIRNIPQLFVGCFSGETDALTHWIEYGRHGVGYAIGFDTETLRAAASIGNAALIRCVYDDDIKTRITVDILGEAEKILSDIVARSQNIPVDMLVNYFLARFISDVAWFVGPIFKNAIFEPEREWRIISSSPPQLSSIGEVKYVAKQNEIREIVELLIKENDKMSPIIEIKVGSNRDERLREISEAVIERLLRANNLRHAKVSVSKSPYRSVGRDNT
jgi:hypothetical protein